MTRFGLLLTSLVLLMGCGQRQSGLQIVSKDGKETKSNPKSLANSIGMKLVLIPAGEFLMGSKAADTAALADEKPQHRVKISKPFYMGVYEVTQDEYERVTDLKKSFFAPTGYGKDRVKGMNTARFPVEQMRWTDAVAFCRKLSELPEEKRAR